MADEHYQFLDQLIVTYAVNNTNIMTDTVVEFRLAYVYLKSWEYWQYSSVYSIRTAEARLQTPFRMEYYTF